jgi:hypothetical protein
MHPRQILILALSLVFLSCVSAPRVSHDSDFNYASVFSSMNASKPTIVNSRLERYTKSFGPLKSSERNGEWEFEILASREWMNEVSRGFRPATQFASYRKPAVLWWIPSKSNYHAYEMQYSSFAAAHLYIEKYPKDKNRIHTFIQRH